MLSTLSKDLNSQNMRNKSSNGLSQCATKNISTFEIIYLHLIITLKNYNIRLTFFRCRRIHRRDILLWQILIIQSSMNTGTALSTKSPETQTEIDRAQTFL